MDMAFLWSCQLRFLLTFPPIPNVRQTTAKAFCPQGGASDPIWDMEGKGTTRRCGNQGGF